MKINEKEFEEVKNYEGDRNLIGIQEYGCVDYKSIGDMFIGLLIIQQHLPNIELELLKNFDNNKFSIVDKNF